MFKNRYVAIAFAALFLVGGFAAAAFITRPTASLNATSFVNNPRQPSGEIPLAGVEASDYAQRHPEMLNSANVVDRSDYFLRHSNVTLAGAAGASDWFSRHPESMIIANAVDLSDYAMRHPAVLTSNGSAAPGDYWQRHPELLRSGNATDSSDWFLRHTH